jgi:hypothetical protein
MRLLSKKMIAQKNISDLFWLFTGHKAKHYITVVAKDAYILSTSI